MWNKVGTGLQKRTKDCGEADECAEEGGGVQRRERGAVHDDARLEEGDMTGKAKCACEDQIKED